MFISYAHDSEEHEERVRRFWRFLRDCGIDARADLAARERPRDWGLWMTREIQAAQHILVVASPEYRKRAEGDAARAEGRGVQWEAGLIRELRYSDHEDALLRVLSVVLPGCSPTDIPVWLGPASRTHYPVTDYTVTGAEKLLRYLTSQPLDLVPDLGSVPLLPPRDDNAGTDILIEAEFADDGQLVSTTWLGGSLLCRQRAPLPSEVARIWTALRLPADLATDRMIAAGRKLAGALLDDPSQRILGTLLHSLPPGRQVNVTFSANGRALALPVELIRVPADAGVEAGPLALLSSVSVSRRPATALTTDGGLRAEPPRRPGPFKVLAAVAAPDETKTLSQPLDVEAEMQAVLDALTDMAGHPDAQVRILEVASLAQIRQALEHDTYHALHLSAHGSSTSVELEDEDGAPAEVTAEGLMEALRHAGRPAPLIVLSSCLGGATGSDAMASSLIDQGAGQVIAMLAPVTDNYAMMLARHLYRELASRQDLAPGQALARARALAEEDHRADARPALPRPEYGVATLLTAVRDGPIVDSAAEREPLTLDTTPPSGTSVRDLAMGQLIGRRAQLRNAMNVLRRTPRALDEFGAVSGVQLLGIGGIGKTALAGRITARLRADGWLIVIHEGRWNPTELIAATADAIAGGQDRALTAAYEALTSQADDGPKLSVVARLLASQRLLLVFDDFEQNLSEGGGAFLDPSTEEIMTGLARSARTGALLITSRYRLPGTDGLLAEIPLPALTPAELRRLFLRLPALRELDAADRRLLATTIGGHPRLIEFTDALLRGGRASLPEVRDKLRDLASRAGVDLIQRRQLRDAADEAMVLGSEDILLAQLQTLLTPRQSAILTQIAVSRAPMTLDDLNFALGADAAAAPADIDRLTDLTLLMPGPDILMHPWTAELVVRNATEDLSPQHDRALAMRLRRFRDGRFGYRDLPDAARHYCHLGRFDELGGFVRSAHDEVALGTLTTVAFLAEVAAMVPPDELVRAGIVDLKVNVLILAGDIMSASQELEPLHRQVAAQAAADPADVRWAHRLSVTHQKLGELAVAAGDLATARIQHQAGHDIAERLAASDPADPDVQHTLSVSHEKLGDLGIATGDRAAARTHYQASHRIRELLAASRPHRTEWQHDLAISHYKLGRLDADTGDQAAARTHYQASHDIADRLAASHPRNMRWQHDLALSHSTLGDVATEAGDQATARSHYQASHRIRELLAATDPHSTQAQRDLAVSHNKLGGLEAAAGDQATARSHYQAGLDIAERLTATNPYHIQWQRDLLISHDRLGSLAAATGDQAVARTHREVGLGIAERLTATDPRNTEWQHDLALSHSKLADVAAAAGDQAAARSHYRASQSICEQLVALDSGNVRWQRVLELTRQRIAGLPET